ncbi:MAG: alkaline phosphatase, partial [Okeania sp. SIO1H6]|nr:alkaline phosphatase [Okeania sp. SIO1H6]
MKNYQDKSKYTNVLGKIIEVTVQSSMVVALMATPSKAIGLSFTPVGTYATGVFDESAARITAFDPNSDRLFVVNDDSLAIDVLNISNPNAPNLDFSIDLSQFGNFGGVNSVAYSNGIFAVAVESAIITDPGEVLFFNSSGNKLNQITVGALPDLLTFTPDGTKLLVANEADPEGYLAGDIDPER